MTPGAGPRITRRVNGVIVEERLHTASKTEDEAQEEGMNFILSGFSQSDFSGPKSGFSRFKNSQPGSVRQANDRPMTDDFGEDQDINLLGQPEGDSRTEFGDFINDEEPSRGTDVSDQEDLWSMDLLDHDGGFFESRETSTVKKTEANLDKELEDEFSRLFG